MSKSDFEVFSEMANADNGHQIISCTTDMVGAKLVKAGTEIIMGIGGNEVINLMNNDKIPILYLVNKKEFFKRKNSTP